MFFSSIYTELQITALIMTLTSLIKTFIILVILYAKYVDPESTLVCLCRVLYNYNYSFKTVGPLRI